MSSRKFLTRFEPFAFGRILTVMAMAVSFLGLGGPAPPSPSPSSTKRS